ncbi:COP23 domain-containing protein [Kovacikia minuta CCNUW1]|uniref:COP23 domain-containing protein n=1 Tax=Kovacikia minuta TaxID=2931930 RepID=UPI001CCD3091|nr:COP23 domain-containing protein [Kovacikia minuta]UBF24623.1 COP23 domain-containing protein [Kovacikia minuta CCNUW1]
MPLVAVKGMGISLGILAMLGSGSAIAAPLFPNAVESSQSDQKTDPGDVVVDTESRPADSTTGTPNSGTPANLAGTRFTCEYRGGEYQVMYHPESQPQQSYPWAKPSALGGGWTPQNRCNEISRRLESYRPDGLLEMRTGVENGYNTVCVTTQRVSNCRIVLTVPPGQDPTSTRDRVFQNLTVADSGQQTQAVNTFVGGSNGDILNQIGQAINNLPNLGNASPASGAINLRPFLDRADGGTGENLQGSVNRPAPRLNPDKFR